MIHGIKKRIFKQLTLFTLIVSSLLYGFTWLIAFVVEDTVIDAMLISEAKFIIDAYEKHGTVPDMRNERFSIHDNSTTLPEEVQKELSETPNAREFFGVGETHYHLTYVRLSPTKSITLLVNVYDYLVVTRMSKVLLVLCIFPLIVCLAIATYFAYRISGNSVKPITELAQTLKTSKTMDLKLNLSKYPDEIGYLASALQTNINLRQEALLRERHFTRDISHELRTPLTVLRNEIQLLEGKNENEEQVSRMRQTLDEINHIISVLFALARAESQDKQESPMTQLLEEVLMSSYTELEEAGVELTLSNTEDVTCIGNKTLITLLIRNLIHNAIRHASEKSMHIALTKHTLSISNPCTNLQHSEKTAQLLAAGVKGDDSLGLGQGLFLSERIAKVLNWQLDVRQKNNVFSVHIHF